MSVTQPLIQVAVPLPVRTPYTYTATADSLPCAGERVRVPVGRRTLTGWVLPGPASVPDGASLKAISKRLDNEPAFPADVLELAHWAARYYQHPPGEVLAAMVPAPLRGETPLHVLQDRLATTEYRAAMTPPAQRAARQAALWHWLKSMPGPVEREAVLRAGYSAQVLKSAVQGGALIESVRYPWESEHSSLGELPHGLNPSQQNVYESIRSAPAGAHLIEGVTGSGKTEIYLHLTMDQIRAGRQVLILVPEIGLTPQFAARFEHAFGSRVALYHSAMTDSERLLTWFRARSGHARVIIGTRSALFLPLPDAGLIIVDEEHDTSYKQQDTFRYHARDLAVVRAHQRNIPVVLGSATPSLESLANVQRGRYTHYRLTRRASSTALPRMRILDIRTRPLTAGLSQPALHTLQQVLDSGQQALVFINRRGYAPVLTCEHCQWIAECHHCDVRLTLHQHPRQLTCHHCDSRYSVPMTCPACGQSTVAPVGAGTERTENELEQLFPDYPVVRIDRDTARQGRDLPRLLQRVHAGEPCLLVGTQMVAKGHDFPNLACVIILNADGGLFSADFRGTEWMAQQLIQVAGRAGRRDARGEVILQTRYPEHPVIQALAHHDYATIARDELAQRRLHHLPPEAQLVAVWGEGRNAEETEAGLLRLRAVLENLGMGCDGNQITGPFPAVIARKKQRFRAVLWLLDSDRNRMRRTLSHWLQNYPKGADGLPPAFRWRLDVDALETL
ncbi:MAG: primosomal protein N' [Gammaproteobacteria bacterium]|nr:MAG: primosomal protein N' [Gammaproteobacteria bacterium]